jgi:cytoskeletal protein RodZ
MEGDLDQKSKKASNTSFDKLGEYLKYTREKRGITVDDAVNDTRIRKSYILALESDNYKDLPERTYALGYLRSYAKYLEIKNIEEVVSYLDSAYDFENPVYGNEHKFKGDDVSYVKKSTLSSKKNNQENTIADRVFQNQRDIELKPRKNKPQNNMIFLFGLGAVIVVAIIWAGLAISDRGAEVAIDESVANEQILSDLNKVMNDKSVLIVTPKESTDLNIQKEETQEKPSSTKEIEVKDNAPSNSNKTINNELNDNTTQKDNKLESLEEKDVQYVPFPKDTMERSISIEFLEDVWVQIHKKGNPNIVYLERNFKAGTVYAVPGVVDLSMTLGNYKGVKITVDGKPITLKSNRRQSLVLSSISLDKNTLLSLYGTE